MGEITTSIQIDKTVPVPSARRTWRSPFHAAVSTALGEMVSGDSFAFSDESKSHSMEAIVRYVAKKAGIKIIIRRVTGNDFRVWRA